MLKTLIILALGAWGTTAALGQTRIIPHVTSPGGFTTKIIVENRAVVPRTFTLVPFDRDGQELASFETTLAGQEILARTSGDLFGESAVSHFEIRAANDIKINVAYNFEAGNGSPAHSEDSPLQATVWRIFPGDWDLVFDGLALVNMGSANASVFIAQKDAQGKVLQTITIEEALGPKSKSLFVVGSPDGTAFSRTPNTFFEVTADQPLAISALRGTLGRSDVGLLWVNDALPLDENGLEITPALAAKSVKGGK